MVHKIDFENSGCYEEVTRSLIRIMGDSTKVREDVDESCITEKIEDRCSEVMVGSEKVETSGAGKLKKPINRKDVSGNRLRCRICKSFRHMERQCKDRQQADNRKNVSGEVLRCISCDSMKHLLSRCPHSWEMIAEESGVNKFNGKLEHSEEIIEMDETVLMVAGDGRDLLGGFGWNYAILDTGCNKSVAGMRWTEEYIRRLSSEDRKKVK